jgi:hypothetical protein
MSNSNSRWLQIDFCGALAILFITLKLTGHIDWSWWWVVSPIWLPFAVLLGLALLGLLGVGLFGLTVFLWEKWQERGVKHE